MAHGRDGLVCARWLAAASLFAAVALPLFACGIWAFWDVFAPLAAGNLKNAFATDGLGIGARTVGFLISLSGAVLWSYGLLGVRRTFREAAAGRALSARAVNGFFRFAIISLVMVFWAVVQRSALVVLFSVSDPSAQGQLSIQLGTPELGRLFHALVFLFVAQVFRHGQAIKEENDGFV